MRIFALLVLLICSLNVLSRPNYYLEKEKAVIALKLLQAKCQYIAEHLSELKKEKGSAQERAGIADMIKKDEEMYDKVGKKLIKAINLLSVAEPKMRALKKISKLAKEL
ncbi:MAG TPA: hypothetical protein VHO47_00150 [Candidatus Babeliales bacterium]|nr:hypothetical protein [Candidatus Babeliales bacterium]